MTSPGADFLPVPTRRQLNTRKKVTDAVMRGAQDFVLYGHPHNPYRAQSWEHRFYSLAFTHAEHARSHKTILPFQDLQCLAKAFLEANPPTPPPARATPQG